MPLFNLKFMAGFVTGFVVLLVPAAVIYHRLHTKALREREITQTEEGEV